MRVLVTGAGGFIGSHLLRGLDRHEVIAASRRPLNGVEWRQLDDLRGEVDWEALLRDVDAVVHLANIAHQTAAEEDFERVNHRATAGLAAAARRAGLRHLIYVSSIYAQVGQSAENIVSETDIAAPENAYGRSKLAAEQAVAASGTPYTNLRPVLLLGEGAKGNISTLYKLARIPAPLPLGGITAKRSFLSVENFSTAVATVLSDQRSKGQTYIVADREPRTVGELVADARAAWGRPAGVFPVPEAPLKLVLRMAGAGGIWEKIGRPLVASSERLMSLGWSPSR